MPARKRAAEPTATADTTPEEVVEETAAPAPEAPAEPAAPKSDARAHLNLVTNPDGTLLRAEVL